VTPVPLDLPLRPPEAAQLARLIFEIAEGRPLTDDLRHRIAARAAVLGLETIRPHFGSLALEPVHRSTYYLAADGLNDFPLLLHMAPATAPTSAIFEKSLLIGRVGDVVVNAIPFGPGDGATIDKFAAQVDSAFLPRAQGARSSIPVTSNLPAAFDVFRAILKRTGRNLASTSQSYYPAVWAAIRAGWRPGYSAGIELKDPADAREVVRECPRYSRFSIRTGNAADAGRVRELIRQARSAANIARPFDFEVSLEDCPAPTTPHDLRELLDDLKSRGQPAQLVAPRLARLEAIGELAAVARRYQAVLSIGAAPEYDSAALDAIARATGGCVQYRAGSGTEDIEFITSHLA
jgi:hypothetical protein